MSYALVESDTITQLGGLPKAARRQDTGEWVLGLRNADVATQEACGWYAVDDSAPKPADTPTDTHDRTVTLVATVPTVQWVQRPKTQAELDADTDAADLTAWLALKPDYIAGRDLPNLGGGALSNAELSSAVREHRQLLRKLCRGNLRLMREYE